MKRFEVKYYDGYGMKARMEIQAISFEAAKQIFKERFPQYDPYDWVEL